MKPTVHTEVGPDGVRQWIDAHGQRLPPGTYEADHVVTTTAEALQRRTERRRLARQRARVRRLRLVLLLPFAIGVYVLAVELTTAGIAEWWKVMAGFCLVMPLVSTWQYRL